ncbi:LacI family DNA-binding transcriptional regulator [Roseateles sp. P5_E7]
MPGKKITVREIALASGVSIGTVSRALKGQPGLSDETRAQILKVASTLRYDVTRLRKSRPSRILFLYPRVLGAVAANQFYSLVLHGVESACREEDVSLSLLSVAAGDDIARQVHRDSADALLAMGHFDPEIMNAMRNCDLPMVLALNSHPAYRCISDDNLRGAYLATQHLIAGGAQRPALIIGPLTHASMSQRAKGFRSALFEAGLLANPNLEVELDTSLEYAEAGRQAMRQLLALPSPPDAVFAFNDDTALNAIAACTEAGLRVPQDIRFVGYDDIAVAARGSPSLTTIRVDKEAIGREAAMALIEDNTGPGEIVLPVELVVRESSVTSAAPATARRSGAKRRVAA